MPAAEQIGFVPPKSDEPPVEGEQTGDESGHRMASMPFLSARARSLSEGPLGRYFAALPFADEDRADVQRKSEGRLAHVRLLADVLDRLGCQRLDGRQTAEIEVAHGRRLSRCRLREARWRPSEAWTAEGAQDRAGGPWRASLRARGGA
jgi:hypothetical protein